MDTINQRMQEIVDLRFEGNKAAFAKAIGIQPSSLSNYLGKQRASKPPVDLLSKIVSSLDVSAEWLMIGKGNMNSNIVRDENESAKHQDILNETGQETYTTYLLPISSRGGTLTGFSAPGTMLQQCEKIISPIADVDFAISVYGESMAPEYPSGSTVLIKRIDPNIFIDWGHVYVLDTPNGVILKKLIYNEQNPEMAICRSINSNPEFSDFQIKLSEVYGIYRVLMCLSVK